MAVTNSLLLFTGQQGSFISVTHGTKTMKIYCLFDEYNVMQFSNDLFLSKKELEQQSEIEAF